VFEFQSDLAAIHVYLAELHWNSGTWLESLSHSEKARDILANVVRDAPPRAEHRAELSRACYNLGQRFGELGRSKEAEDAFRQGLLLQEKLVADYPDVPYYRMMLGNLNLFLGDLLSGTERRAAGEAAYRKALSSYEKLRTEFPRMPVFREGTASAMVRLGTLLHASGNPQEAEKRFREARAIYDELLAEFPARVFYRKGQVDAYLSLGLVLVVTNRVNEADEAFGRLLPVLPENARASGQAWYYYGWARRLVREPRLPPRGAVFAVELAKKAVELAPANPRHSNALGMAYYRAGDWNAAVGALEKSMELSKGGDSFDWFFLSMAHWQLGKKDEARRRYDQAIAWMEMHQPKDEELLRFRAEAEDLMQLKK
jgi:tetratricopeptide (TPR) repeat protein